jgi:hypothetical protein
MQSNLTKTTWIEDANGNKCSAEYFGSIEAAQKALDSLVNCKNCIDCSNCSNCSDCSYCSYCSGCSRCSDKSKTQGDFTPPVIPKIENIHQRVYAAVSTPNALNMAAWHTCDTTHCRAGWVVHLAGEAGYALERFHNTPLAAQLIYEASGYKINPGRFYDSDADALADMKNLAGK